MRIAILVSYNEQLVKRAFGFVVYACMQPCSHAAMQTDALLRLLYRCCMYGAIARVALLAVCWCHCARCVVTVRIGSVVHVALLLYINAPRTCG